MFQIRRTRRMINLFFGFSCGHDSSSTGERERAANQVTSVVTLEGGKIESLQAYKRARKESLSLDQVSRGHPCACRILLALRRLRSEQMMEAVLRRVANTKSHGIIACDANMEHLEVKLRNWYNKGKAPALGVSMYSAEGRERKSHR